MTPGAMANTLTVNVCVCAVLFARLRSRARVNVSHFALVVPFLVLSRVQWDKQLIADAITVAAAVDRGKAVSVLPWVGGVLMNMTMQAAFPQVPTADLIQVHDTYGVCLQRGCTDSSGVWV